MADPTPEELPQALVNAIYTIFGDHHARAVHAKGILLEGAFVPDPRAGELCRAPLFAAGLVPTLIRFSNTTGIPTLPDPLPDASPHGLGLKFRVPGHPEVDAVAHSFAGFPARNPAEFLRFLLAAAASGAEVPSPKPIEKFVSEHPAALAYVTQQKGPPASFATLTYYGVNAFQFTNASGVAVFVRSRFVPRAGEQLLDAAAVATRGPNYLHDEIAARLAQAPAVLDWWVQVAEAGDAVDDPTAAWPETRKLVRLGAVEAHSVIVDQKKADRTSSFSPGRLQDGMAPADPMIRVRDAAYELSFRRRQ
ncbi:MAG TPA: catalase family peroxidase [Myxococcota bacterium]|nr:catalase family peroxidase [Myxococcota bacterium]